MYKLWLAKLIDEEVLIHAQVKNLEKLHSNMKEASRASYRLQRESASALQDLRAVAQVKSSVLTLFWNGCSIFFRWSNRVINSLWYAMYCQFFLKRDSTDK